MRAQDEIVARVQEMDAGQHGDFFGFCREALLQCLDFEHAKPWLKEDAEPENWPVVTRDGLVEIMRDYMEFAWGKALDHRGLSASRSITKFEAWVWVLGDDELLRSLQAAPYAQYGAPQLRVVCDALGFPVPDDEGAQRMMYGELCTPDCESGCGR